MLVNSQKVRNQDLGISNGVKIMSTKELLKEANFTEKVPSSLKERCTPVFGQMERK